MAAGVVVNMLKCAVAEKLTRLGKPPHVLTSSVLIGPERSAAQFDAAYDEYRRGLVRVLGGVPHD
ncbi:MAG: hypothetical protein D6790_11905 [Caldilineae bacterium]|nr:MAG: hypothetical protein D6790_11905 [Caldilineae bacterium]